MHFEVRTKDADKLLAYACPPSGSSVKAYIMGRFRTSSDVTFTMQTRPGTHQASVGGLGKDKDHGPLKLVVRETLRTRR